MQKLTHVNVNELRALAQNLVNLGNSLVSVLDRLPNKSSTIVALDLSENAYPVDKQLKLMAKVVASACRVPEGALYSKTRCADVALARQICFWLGRQFTTASLKRIGSVFRRDHGTVLYGTRAVEDIRSVDSVFAKRLENIVAECRAILN